MTEFIEFLYRSVDNVGSAILLRLRKPVDLLCMFFYVYIYIYIYAFCTFEYVFHFFSCLTMFLMLELKGWYGLFTLLRLFIYVFDFSFMPCKLLVIICDSSCPLYAAFIGCI